MAALAVPETVSVKNITGVYDLNKTLSDSSANLLYMQNVGWVIRQAVAWSAVQVTLISSETDGVLTIEQQQWSTGGQHNVEHWVLDGKTKDKESKIWGQVSGYHKFSKLSDINDDYLNEEWEEVDGDVIEAEQQSEVNGWKVHQLMGFAVIDGVRRHVRRIIGTKGDQVEKVRMIYDWKFPYEEKTDTEASSAFPDDAMPDL